MSSELQVIAGGGDTGADQPARNEGMPLDLSWLRDARVNRSSVERRAATLGTRRTVKKDWQAAWLLKAVTAQKNSPQAAEIRAHWRGQKSPLLELSKIFQTGEILTISAVLSAPAYLSGLGEKHQGELRKLAATILVPDKVNAREETDAAIQHVERATDNFAKTMAANLNEWRDRDAELIEETLKRAPTTAQTCVNTRP